MGVCCSASPTLAGLNAADQLLHHQHMADDELVWSKPRASTPSGIGIPEQSQHHRCSRGVKTDRGRFGCACPDASAAVASVT
jgi:hypothetical protein